MASCVSENYSKKQKPYLFDVERSNDPLQPILSYRTYDHEGSSEELPETLAESCKEKNH